MNEQQLAEPDDEDLRFRQELEFVQCLANPRYIECNFNVNVCPIILFALR
jgi:hypothetical protein